MWAGHQSKGGKSKIELENRRSRYAGDFACGLVFSAYSTNDPCASCTLDALNHALLGLTLGQIGFASPLMCGAISGSTCSFSLQCLFAQSS
jgi:hypothetical protein